MPEHNVRTGYREGDAQGDDVTQVHFGKLSRYGHHVAVGLLPKHQRAGRPIPVKRIYPSRYIQEQVDAIVEQINNPSREGLGVRSPAGGLLRNIAQQFVTDNPRSFNPRVMHARLEYAIFM